MDIKVERLKVQFGDREILKNISLDFPKQKFTGIIGPNGSGKSTMLKCIYRVLEPDSGVIYLNGKPLEQYTVKQSAQLQSVLAQHNYYNFDFEVLDVVLMGRSPYKNSMEDDNAEDYAIANEALRVVGMEKFAQSSFSLLSGGEQQRVMLARALTQQTECLVLDEPTNHLDIKYQLQIMDIVKALDLTVVAAVHDLNIAAMYCDRLVAIKSGQVVGLGTPRELLTERFIYDMYGVRCRVDEEENTGRINIVYLPQHWL